MATVELSATVGKLSPSDMIVDGFGLGRGARVQEDRSGTLGGKASGTITNSGATSPLAGYTVEVRIDAMELRAVRGSAAFLPAKTIFRCKKNGPPLAARSSASVTFRFGSGGCSPLTASLPCGLYREVLTIRGVDRSGRPFVRRSVLYISIPSAVKDIQFLTIPDPGDPNGRLLEPTPGAGPGYIVLGLRFNFIAPDWVGPRPSYRGNAYSVRIVGVPANSRFVVSGKGRTDLASGAGTSYNPGLPAGQPNGVKGPKAFNYVLTVPNKGYVGPWTGTIDGDPGYEAKLDGTITAISVERKQGKLVYGCVIRQLTLPVSAWFES